MAAQLLALDLTEPSLGGLPLYVYIIIAAAVIVLGVIILIIVAKSPPEQYCTTKYRFSASCVK